MDQHHDVESLGATCGRTIVMVVGCSDILRDDSRAGRHFPSDSCNIVSRRRYDNEGGGRVSRHLAYDCFHLHGGHMIATSFLSSDEAGY